MADIQKDIREGRTLGKYAKNVFVDNDDDHPVPVSGTFATGEVNFKAPTGPFFITVGTATSTATNPLLVPLTARVSLSVRNKSDTATIYVGRDALVTADDTSTGGWEIGPREDFNLDLNATQAIFFICPAGQSALYKIFEIAST